MRWVWIGGLVLGLGACGVVPNVRPQAEVSGEGRAIGVTTDILVRPRARPAGFAPAPEDEIDLGSGEVSAGAVTPASGALGTTVASLGNPAEPGLWLKTPLVSKEQSGQVRDPATGKSVTVTLIPLDGPPTAGSQLSLSAMQGLGVALSDLPTVEVFAEA